MRSFIPMTEVFTLSCGDILIPRNPEQPKLVIKEIKSYGAKGDRKMQVGAFLLDDSAGDTKYFREQPGQPIREITSDFKEFSGIEREENLAPQSA
jgi:hypothetical protein